MVSSVANSTSTSAVTSSTPGTTSAQDQTDRFMKLLVAQLNNQDPMNPMDNAQMTSQIAQINTVSGIQDLNTTMKAMSSQFSALQSMQGVSMIGRNVLADGNTLPIDSSTHSAKGAFNLSEAASSVSVQVMSPGGQVVDTINLGAMTAGNHNFDWDASRYASGGTPTFKVVANQGSNAVASSPLIRGTVTSIGTDSTGAMSLQLGSGTNVAFTSVKSIL